VGDPRRISNAAHFTCGASEILRAHDGVRRGAVRRCRKGTEASLERFETTFKEAS
jgi:hypothetical protein